jgi:hypothetical protein
LWPLQLPLSVKCIATVILLAASQYHYWSRLSSGSIFSPEFPRPMIILFNWAFGAMLLLTPMQVLLDLWTLIGMVVHGGERSGHIPPSS